MKVIHHSPPPPPVPLTFSTVATVVAGDDVAPMFAEI